jgi:hypothetical protein
MTNLYPAIDAAKFINETALITTSCGILAKINEEDDSIDSSCKLSEQVEFLREVSYTCNVNSII